MSARILVPSWICAGLILACTHQGEEVATTFLDPTANPSGTPPTTGSPTAGDTASDSGSGGPAETSATDTATSNAGTTMDAATETGVQPIDEQPAAGMYSACVNTGECIGLTACVLVAGAPAGFCSLAGCVDAGMQCDANPGAMSSAIPACVDDGMGVSVCALTCEGAATCPGGMECLPLGMTSVCV
ncbi:MAG: hypothetical protein K0V04_34940 [Deltaproteobacteria bacterium]|nr:hypothetical protein [Deltaproteobacteria bacterium]